MKKPSSFARTRRGFGRWGKIFRRSDREARRSLFEVHIETELGATYESIKRWRARDLEYPPMG